MVNNNFLGLKTKPSVLILNIGLEKCNDNWPNSLECEKSLARQVDSSLSPYLSALQLLPCSQQTPHTHSEVSSPRHDSTAARQISVSLSGTYIHFRPLLQWFPTCSQFHQHFAYEFFVRTSFSLVTFGLAPKIRTKNAREKRWWNWHLGVAPHKGALKKC